MSSEISNTLRAYRESLNASRARYETLYTERGENAVEFYRAYLHSMTRHLAATWSDPGARRRLHRSIERFFGTTMLDFVAIDGSCNKDLFSEFVVFSACAYGAKGQLELHDDNRRPSIRYRRWQLERDVSMVAYVPVPMAQLAEATGSEEDFLMSDAERVNLSHVHTKLMQLAEVFLAYNVVTSSAIERPRLVLMDLLPSSIIASIASKPDAVNLCGYRHDRRRLDFRDIVTALAHPFSHALRLPNTNRFRLHSLVLSELARSEGDAVDLRQIAETYSVDVDALRRAVKRGPLFGDLRAYRVGDGGLLDQSTATPTLIPRVQRLGALQDDVFSSRWDEPGGGLMAFDVRESWEFTKGLFQSICKRLFREKKPEAMIYTAEDEHGVEREHWLDPNDIDFLTGVGLRALVEACWEQKVMLLGIAKDSSSRYFTRNYLGVLKHAVQIPELATRTVDRLPWTDRMFFEFIGHTLDELEAPWGTCEFDSAFMTLWMKAIGRENDGDDKGLGAVQDYIIAHMGLFSRSLAQFYINRSKRSPLMGHVVFVDRLCSPELDAGIPRLDLTTTTLEARGVSPHHLGNVYPIGFTNGGQPNAGQDIAMYLLHSLTRNHYPEVIGYPDPLHKADWGAKTLGDRLRATIRSSEVSFNARPLARTLRSIRESYRRR